MSALTIDPIAAIAAGVLILLIVALVWATSRRPFVREIERLKDDLHKAVASRNRGASVGRQRQTELVRGHHGKHQSVARSR